MHCNERLVTLCLNNIEKEKQLESWVKKSKMQHSYIQLSLFYPLTPNSDQHLISPYNNIPESHIKVMRVKEMITN